MGPTFYKNTFENGSLDNKLVASSHTPVSQIKDAYKFLGGQTQHQTSGPIDSEHTLFQNKGLQSVSKFDPFGVVTYQNESFWGDAHNDQLKYKYLEEEGKSTGGQTTTDRYDLNLVRVDKDKLDLIQPLDSDLNNVFK